KWKEKSRKEKLLSVAKWVGMGVACMAVASVGATGIAAELMGASGIAGIIGGATMTASAGVFGRNALMKEDIKFTNAVYKINNNEKLSPHQKRKAVEQVLGDMNMDNGPLSISFYIDSQDLIMPQNKENKKNSRVSLSEHIKPQDLATAYSHVESKVAWRQKENNTGEKNGANGNVRKLDISDILRNLGGKDIE
ncbi:MAG: hypothetical protein II830_01450, partial [Alphaproteobacteria bacterium]|nr:hypothetical protein [Alphaproteobacteria bacterium]